MFLAIFVKVLSDTCSIIIQYASNGKKTCTKFRTYGLIAQNNVDKFLAKMIFFYEIIKFNSKF